VPLLQGEFRFFGFGKGETRRLQGDTRISLEPSYRHLLKTSFHDFLQKVKGYVLRLIRNRLQTEMRKYYKTSG
jgi:hypothetical protein